MYIRNLVEDTVGENGMGCEHGLSFYAETPGHKPVSYTHLDVYKRQGGGLR